MSRFLGLALSILLALFLAFTVAAAALYPGGTWCDRSSPGYDLALNYLCDLLHERGLNRAPNPGAGLARAGMLLLSAALIPFWLGVAKLTGARPRLAAAIRGLGVLSAIGTLVVSANPSDHQASLHQVAVLGTTATAIAAGLAGAVGLASSANARPLGALAVIALSFAALDGALYLREVLSPQRCATLLPILQKLAGLAILAWMAAVAGRLLRTPNASEATGSRAA